MDKLDLHEFLRIYVPGLYVSLIGGWLLHGSHLDTSKTAVVAIFVGFGYSHLASRLAQRYFLSLTRRQIFEADGQQLPFHAAWVHVVSAALQRLKRDKEADEVSGFSDKDVGRFAFAHYAGQYSGSALYSFRLQKTLGVLYCNLGIASAGAVALASVGAFVGLLDPGLPSPWSLLGLFLAASGLFLAASKYHFLASLNLEIHYWRNPPTDLLYRRVA